jgi:hypothetical protein
MADVITYQRFWQRRDTAANWTSVNPTLAAGEFGYETDTGKLKIGDGSTVWTSLDYLPQAAEDVPYDNSASSLSAANVQDAIDELAASGGGGGGGADVFAEASESWDFISHGLTNSTSTGTSFDTPGALPVAYVAGTGAAATISSEAGAPGIAVLSTGSTSTGYVRLFFCRPLIFLGGGEVAFRARIRIPTLSNSTDRFGAGVVMTNVISGAVQRIGAVYFDNVNSGQWVADAIGAGTTTTNTTVAPTANTWTVLELRPNAAGTAWSLYIGPDGGSLTNAGTVSSNLPTVALGLSVQISKTVGTTARTVEVDLASFRKTFTATR